MTTTVQYGKVYLIGAGPGAADLITVRGARILALADLVLHDALITDDMLELCSRAIKIPVGKRFGKHSTAQSVINEKLVDCAKNYALVVRLKGGDPMLFGRADEELCALEAAGIEVEIIPGITSAFAAAAATKQPLTKRGVARSVGFFTSSTAPDEPDHVTLPVCDTLVQYMGGREAVSTAQKMLAQGHSADLPVIVVENCSRPNQRIVRLKLSTLEQGLPLADGPVLVMMGEGLAERPLAACRT